MAWFRRRRRAARKPAVPPCPECGKPTTLGGRFCRACGWDADLEESDDAYLDGVDLPEGWGGEAPAEGDGLSPRMRLFLLVGAILALFGFLLDLAGPWL